MENATVYHGASNGNGPWPGAAGGAPPALLLAKSLWIDAGLLLPCADRTGDEIPFLANSESYPLFSGQCFGRVMVFPQPGAHGGSAARYYGVLPEYFNPAYIPLFRICWYQLGVMTWFQVANWGIAWSVFRDGSGFGAPGARVLLPDVVLPGAPVVPCQWTDTVAIAATGAHVPPQAGDLFNVDVHCAAGVAGSLCLIGIEMRYRLIP